MLKSLSIKNVALIENAEIDFQAGLNILSGETGAGKSVILDSLNFAFGAKADKTMIRRGADFSSVKAVFEIDDESIFSILKENDIEPENTLIISRKFSQSGSGEVKINGETIPVSVLKKITSKLIDIHGQSEHFYLLKETNQLNLIDKFNEDKITKIKDEIAKNVSKLKEVLTSLETLGGDEKQRAIRLDILTYQVDEIEKVDFKENEDVELLDLKNKLLNQEKILDALKIAKQAIFADGSATDCVSTASAQLNSISNLSEEYSSLSERLQNVYTELDDISDCISDIIDGFDYNGYDLEKVEDRLYAIKNIKKKYGNDYFEVQKFLENAKEEIENLNNFDILADKLLKEKDQLKTKIYSLYLDLSVLRKKSAKDFSKKVVEEIRELNMKNANFEVNFSDLPSIDDCSCTAKNGIDEISFLFSANLGEPLKPLSKIISGGEISRFMLAIKAQSAKFDSVKTLIFDEIDAGISGETATVVGEKFCKIAKTSQIIAISHLPQIAVCADNNLLIKKIESNDKTVTTVKNLSENEKISEIVRLVGGSILDENAVLHAKTMLEKAVQYKNSL